MATFVVCTRCGRVQEIFGIDLIPDHWVRTPDELLCLRCVPARSDDVLDEEVIDPSDIALENIPDEPFCEVCIGPCQGH